MLSSCQLFPGGCAQYKVRRPAGGPFRFGPRRHDHRHTEPSFVIFILSILAV